jgi:STE24 endopeptidase
VVRRRIGVPLALLSAVAVAEAAVLLLRPREGVLESLPVSARSYFSATDIERARDFRRPQLALFGGSLLVEATLLAGLVRRPPRMLRRRFRHPLAAATLAGAALSVALDVSPLPLAAVARQRAVDVGLVTNSWADWAGDTAKGWGIGAVLAGGAGAAGIGLMRRFGRRWWLAASPVVVLLGAGFVFAGPVVLDPIFNRFTPLPPGEVRSDVLALADRAGVKVGEVYEVDASRRTTAANAYVTGLGSTKRVVLYDTLIEHFSRPERQLVVAHELGHVRHHDVPRGLLYLALVVPASLFAAARLTERLAAPSLADHRPGPAALPALALSVAIAGAPVSVVSNQLSRRIEARADTFSLRLTHAPEAFISFERRIAVRNVIDPDPPRWIHTLMGTHPTTVERIGIARAFEAGRR